MRMELRRVKDFKRINNVTETPCDCARKSVRKHVDRGGTLKIAEKTNAPRRVISSWRNARRVINQGTAAKPYKTFLL
jgi:hypothetical protein